MTDSVIGTMEDIGLILKALEFAAVRHKNQFRKGEDRPPYINHPIQVANLLANDAGEKDAVLLSASILHDVIEDTVETGDEKEQLIREIRNLFGDEVLDVTLEVTDDKSLRKPERKRLQVVHAPHMSDRAKKLKIADKILNVRDIKNNPPVGWHYDRIIEYFNWAEQVVSGLRGVNRKLEEMFDKTLAEAREKYNMKE
ncbi:MAG TPA: HD domain-containing protein [Bacteroidales bacterium]|nr:HD domain-containing protein [Bacteroidales bacterium]